MSKVIKVISFVLAAIGLGCIVKHIAMVYSGKIDECCCMQHLKNKDWSSIHKWKKSCCGGDNETSSEAKEDVEFTTKKSAFDAAIDQYANGEISREQLDEIKRNLI